MRALARLPLFSRFGFGVMPVYFLNRLTALKYSESPHCSEVTRRIQMGLWKTERVRDAIPLRVSRAGDGWAWGLTSSFSVVVGLVSAASACTGERFLPF